MKSDEFCGSNRANFAFQTLQINLKICKKLFFYSKPHMQIFISLRISHLKKYQNQNSLMVNHLTSFAIKLCQSLFVCVCVFHEMHLCACVCVYLCDSLSMVVYCVYLCVCVCVCVWCVCLCVRVKRWVRVSN